MKSLQPVKPVKLIEAEKLSQSEDLPSIQKGVELYRKLWYDTPLDASTKIEVLCSMRQNLPDEGLDVLNRLRDSITFLRGTTREKYIQTMVQVCRHPQMPPEDRLLMAVSLYNLSYPEYCYDCFSCLAADASVPPAFRAEACKFLFGSGIPEHTEVSQTYLLEIIGMMEVDVTFRYSLIASFISRTGIKTLHNAQKLLIAYDEDFVYSLQKEFYQNTQNDVRYRILSGQYLLGIASATEEEKREIVAEMLSISRSEEYNENTRADSADVVLRLGNVDERVEARLIITQLGQSTAKDGISGRSRTIYTDSQNVHNEKISDTISEQLVKLANLDIPLKNYQSTYQEVSELINTLQTADKRFKCNQALHRINIDTATFTQGLTSADVLNLVWSKIASYPSDQRSSLKDRLLEELMDMSDTCSSGHIARLINVFSEVDGEMRISWVDQIISNLSGRVQARIKGIKDADLQIAVTMGSMESAEEEEKAAYQQFIQKALEELHEELYKEFVDDGYITAEEFESHFEVGRRKWT